MRTSIFATSLSAKLLAGLAAGLLLSSLFFLMLFVGAYREQLARERGLVSEQVNRLLQTSLQNAMLKRDLPGLEDIVHNLGQQPGIAGVMIANPELEVRFASDKSQLGGRLGPGDLGCNECASGIAGLPPSTRLMQLGDGQEVMRSVNPIRNRTECQQCHGPIASHPVNGILVVDQATTGVREDAMRAAGMMAGAGAAVMALALLGAWAFMNRTVVQPIAELERASRALASGKLDTQVEQRGSRSDEIAGLRGSFNAMAASLRSSLDAIQEKERFLQAVIDTVPDGVRVLDERYQVVMANQAYAGMVGAAGLVTAVGLPCYAARGRSEPCVPTLTTCPFHALSETERSLRYMHEIADGKGGQMMAEISASRSGRRAAHIHRRGDARRRPADPLLARAAAVGDRAARDRRRA